MKEALPDSTSILNTAALWRRLAAMVYDGIVVFAIWIFVGFLVLSAFGLERAQSVQDGQVVMDPLYRASLFAAMLGSAYLFFAWFWTHSGQTIGMQAWRIRVQNYDGSAISYRQSLIRFLLAPVSLLLLGAGYFMMLFDRHRQTFHDRLSKSQVCMVPI